MYNIIEQGGNSTSKSRASIGAMLNDTSKPIITTTSAGYKIDCAKECPCGVPVIPVPEQWLEVMVTGGFKVWHIIFIIIAFLVTMVVVYCCFHRCRIPRTKQEIEADLMRSNLTNKFRDYLQEFPNEPTTFLEALKRVHDLEEKSEQDDIGARKRKGWLKLRGKDRQGGDKAGAEAGKEEATEDQALAAVTTTGEEPPMPSGEAKTDDTSEPSRVEKPENGAIEGAEENPEKSPDQQDDKAPPNAEAEKPHSKVKSKRALKSKMVHKSASKAEDPKHEQHEPKVESPQEANKPAKTKSERTGTAIGSPPLPTVPDAPGASQTATPGASGSAASNRPARARKKREKPNLSRTKATHLGSRGESMENHNILNIPVASHHHHHHHHQQHHNQDARHHQHHHHQNQAHESKPGEAQDQSIPKPTETTSGRRRAQSKTKQPKESTIIQIESSPPRQSKSSTVDKR